MSCKAIKYTDMIIRLLKTGEWNGTCPDIFIGASCLDKLLKKGWSLTDAHKHMSS